MSQKSDHLDYPCGRTPWVLVIEVEPFLSIHLIAYTLFFVLKPASIEVFRKPIPTYSVHAAMLIGQPSFRKKDTPNFC